MKPEFWSDEKLAPLPPIHRLVFLGLISHADDAGRLVDNVKLIDGMLFPETADTCASSLVVLTTLGRVVRYRSASGQRLLQLTNWERHQKVKNASIYTLPGPDDKGWSSPVPTSPVSGGESAENLRRVGGEPGEDVPCIDKDGNDAGESVTPLSPIPYPLSPIPYQRSYTASSAQPRRRERARASIGPHPSEAFRDAMASHHPERRGASTAAWRQWRARLVEDAKQGKRIAEREAFMVAQTRAHAAYHEAKGTEPRFIKLAGTFFGRDRHYEAAFGPLEPAKLDAYLTDDDLRDGTLNPDVIKAFEGSFGPARGLLSQGGRR